MAVLRKEKTGKVKRALLTILALLLAPPAWGTIAFDAASEGSGTTSLSWTHTPVADSQGVFVFCMNADSSTDVFSGATYDGEAMTQIASASDTVTEPGFVEAYFLGTGINTGAVTVVCTVASGSDNKHGVAITVTAASDTQTAGTGSCTVNENATNPSCDVTGISGASYAAGGLYSGRNNVPANVTAGTGFTIRHDIDHGNNGSTSESSTTQQASGSQTIAFTAAADDVAMVGIAIEQTTPDGGAAIRRRAVVIQ
jgi:hypothetical protein